MAYYSNGCLTFLLQKREAQNASIAKSVRTHDQDELLQYLQHVISKCTHRNVELDDLRIYVSSWCLLESVT